MILLNYIWVLWLLGMPIYFTLAYEILKYRTTLIKKTFVPINPKKMIFQITTIGNMSIVQESVNNINRICREVGYSNYEVLVVSEVKEAFDGAKTITVPKEYSTPHKAKYKTRALHYAVEYRENSRENTKDVWIYHLDDESMVTKQGLLSVLDHIDNNREPIAEGLITYPNKLEVGSKLVKYLDAVRPTFCYSCCAMLKSKGKPDWLHGSNLLVRADIEKSIGWDFANSCAEDSLFGYIAHKRYGGIFGWHGGILEEQSPFTFSDFVKQRQRWIRGNIENLSRLGVWEKFKGAYRMTSWFLGALSSFTLIPALLIRQSYPWFLTPFFVFNTIILFGIYQIGLGMNFSKVSKKQRIVEHIKLFFVSPLLWFLEGVPMVLYFFKRASEFYVIKK
ncbi:MAG: glycosyltransferase family 2 protein [Candidatus Bathyarchaeota archaeon]|nr:glycosyltransferase family 2 protein [Candidatus Bathyarchaeota archaeon]